MPLLFILIFYVNRLTDKTENANIRTVETRKRFTNS